MPYERGNESLEREVFKLQLFAEDASDELHGTPGKVGIIELVRNREVREIGRKEAREKSDKRLTLILGGLAAIPVLLKLAEHFHWF